MHFSAPLEFKAPQADVGAFAGHLAVFHSIDLGGDAIQPGSFQRTLAEAKAPVPLLWNHDAGVVLGRFTELREDAKGLFARGQLTLETQEAREKFQLLRDRAVTGLSIGYHIPEGGSERKNGVRLIKQIDLYEGSLVAIPLHPEARVAEVKSLLDCRDAHELKLLLRERDGLSRTKSTAAAGALWGILHGASDDDEISPELARELKRMLDMNSQLKRI